jgi:hypothetical protein
MTLNRLQHALVCLSVHINNFRIIPRLILLGYWHLIWHLVSWYEALGATATTQQTSFVSVILGTFPLVLNFYLTSGGDVKVPPTPGA